MPPSNANLGAAIRRLRRERRLSIEELAFGAGWHPTYVSQVERGLKSPTWAKLCALAAALDVPVSRLARDAEDEAIVARTADATRARLREERRYA